MSDIYGLADMARFYRRATGKSWRDCVFRAVRGATTDEGEQRRLAAEVGALLGPEGARVAGWQPRPLPKSRQVLRPAPEPPIEYPRVVSVDEERKVVTIETAPCRQIWFRGPCEAEPTWRNLAESPGAYSSPAFARAKRMALAVLRDRHKRSARTKTEG